MIGIGYVLIGGLVFLIIVTLNANRFAKFNFEGDVEMASQPTPKQIKTREDKTLLGTVKHGLKKVFIDIVNKGGHEKGKQSAKVV